MWAHRVFQHVILIFKSDKFIMGISEMASNSEGTIPELKLDTKYIDISYFFLHMPMCVCINL